MTSSTHHHRHYSSVRGASVRGLIATAALGLSATPGFADLTEDVATLMSDIVQGGEWGFLLKTELFGNGNVQDNPNGVGLANTIVADEFVMGCDHSGHGWLDLHVVDLDGDGPPSTLQWHLVESNAVVTPGTETASSARTTW